MRRLLFFVSLASMIPSAAQAHGSVDERAMAIEHRILAEPTNPNHYLRRAALLFERGDIAGARASLAMAVAFGASDLAVAVLQARVELSENHPRAALAAINAVGASQRTEDLLRLRALALRELGPRDEAAEAFADVLSAAARPSPDDFLDAARAFRAAGDEARAVAVLDAGVVRLGRLAALEQAAIEIEVERKDFAAALGRLDALLERNPHNRSWVERREQIARLARDEHPAIGANDP